MNYNKLEIYKVFKVALKELLQLSKIIYIKINLKKDLFLEIKVVILNISFVKGN